MTEKITSVLELACYAVGDRVYKISISYPYPVPDLTEDEELAIDHPRDLFVGPFKHLWPSKAKLPRLSYFDFNLITNILTAQLRVDDFFIDDLIRSMETGQFLYYDGANDWMPEDCLFPTMSEALREKTRILRLLRNWTKQT